MDKQSNQQQQDAGRKANFIDRHSHRHEIDCTSECDKSNRYDTDPIFKMMVDETQYFTETEQKDSQKIIGGQYKDGKFLNL